MLGGFRRRSLLDAHVGNDGRDAAALLQPFDGLRTRKSGFDNFNASSGQVVFGAQGDDRAASMKNISNQLESGGAHQAVRVNAQSNVVNRFAAMHRFRNHELLVFGPCKLGGQLDLGHGGIPRRSGELQQPLDQGMKGFDGGRIDVPLIGGQHGAETIRGSENKFGELPAAGLRHLRGEHVFELVGKFAQLVKTASRRITLESVDGAANTTDHFLVAGTGFELEASLIERVEQFVRAFEEQGAQLTAAIVERTFHEVTSLR